MSTLATTIQHSFGSPSHSNQRSKRNKKNPNWKGRSKTNTIHRGHDTILENPKDDTRKLLELIHEFGKVTGYKINPQKSRAFVYTNNERSEREFREAIPFTMTPKRIKYLGIILPKERKFLYFENYKMLMKEIKDDTTDRKT